MAIACGSGEGSEFTPETPLDEAGGPPVPGPFVPTDGGDGGPSTCKPRTCADEKANCGPIGDGCGGIVLCGTCTTAGQTCGGGGVPSQCGIPACTKVTCLQQNVSCGAAADGCGGVITTCGACDTANGAFCGGGGPSKCGTGIVGDGGVDGGSDGGGVCVPRTCVDLGANCGMQADGCGVLMNCGTCMAAGESCGGGGTPSQCGKACNPKTMCPVGQDCGVVADGCGGVVSCGPACVTGSCGGGGMPNVCGTNVTCTGLCTQQTVCDGGGTTSISGTVTAPNGTLPIYGALVYVPSAPVAPFPAGVACEQCGASAGTPLVSATTSSDGTFLLPNMPVSSNAAGKVQNIPVVIQLGRWRKQLTVVTTACGNVVIPTADKATGGTTLVGGGARPVPDAVTAALPRNKTEGDIPLTAISTGNVDGLECVFRKIGIQDSEFTNPSGNGRIRFYQDNGAVITQSSGTCSVSGATCSNFGGSCGNSCSADTDRTCNTAGSACSLQCGGSGNNCTVAGQNCNLRCTTSTGSSCTTPGASCNNGTGVCATPGRCTSDDNRCGVIGTTCNGGAGMCVAELRCTSDGGRCDARDEPVGTSCDSGRGTCQIESCQGGTCTSKGTCTQNAGTPAANTLYNNPAELAKYDITLFECVGARADKTATQQANVRDYANSGGRVYATHFSYVWLYNAGAAPWNATGSWAADSHSWTSAIATLDTSFPKGQAFAQWLNSVGALTTALPAGGPPWMPPPQITINESRHDLNDPIVSPAQRWLYTTAADSPNVASVQHYTFNTDWNKPANQQCGRVLFSDFHVSTNSSTNNVVFPAECDNNPLTTQEKVLAFMLFDLASCVSVAPPPTMCNALSCMDQGIDCGQAGDGCGKVITCPNCPIAGQTCGGGGTPNKCGASACVPALCPAGTCGIVGDGCGGTSPCAPCAAGNTCGGGGMAGVCGAGQACVKGMCPAPAIGAQCGPTTDGCGGLLNCSCPGGTSCINGKCAVSACVPRTCMQAGANCGQIADGCGGLLNCGVCLAPQTCGGGGNANVCGGGVN